MFAENLKKLRKDNKVTQVELATHLGFFHSAVVKWEKGECEPSYDTLIKIADYFGTTVDDLLGHNAKKSPLTERLANGVSAQFEVTLKELLKEQRYVDATKLYNEMSDEFRERIYTYIIGVATGLGLPITQILGR